MTIYYTAPYDKKTKVTALKKGFRMLIGDSAYRSPSPNPQESQSIAFRCFTEPWGPAPANSAIGDPKWDTRDFPKQPCLYGLRVNNLFAYPSNGTFRTEWECPESHPVKLPQLMYEAIRNTSAFNYPSMWPEDGSQPFVLSMGDGTEFGWHGDYMFGWKGDSLQRAMDRFCSTDCPELETQTVALANECAKGRVVDEEMDGWLDSLPGGMPVTGN